MKWTIFQITIQCWVVCLAISLVNGVRVKTKYDRTSGDGEMELTCARDAVDRKYLATKVDPSNVCTSLDWDWGSAPTFATGSTYYEKKHVVEVYDPPTALEGTMKLPITFEVGAYVDMHIEFTTLDFSYGAILLLDTLDEAYHVYQGDAETLMVNMEIYAQSNDVVFKTWWDGWVNHCTLNPSPFTIGPVFKITFKALTDDIQVLVNDVEKCRIDHYVPSKDARMLQFLDVGMLLHKIEFVGV